MAELVRAFGKDENRICPYVLGGIGVYNVKVTRPLFGIDTSVTKVGLSAGGGFAFRLGNGRTRLFVDVLFVNVSVGGGANTTFLPIRAGFRFGK